MRLLRIQIEKFGTLSQFSMDLKEGVNEVLEENGWGKSTLAAFLRVMFYGLEGARKKELSENDRLKYQPWDQGPFGGSIEFEVNGKCYVATRFFGQKEKDATFRLQDATTLLDSKDYSERLGEELFGIDRESFEKTSFIDGDAIRYHGINSAIGSKVGSISQTDDLANYDAAQEQMKDFLNANSPKKRTGKLFQIEDSIKELERDLKKMDAAKESTEGIKQLRERENEKLLQCKAERENAQKELNGLLEKRKILQDQKHKAELEAAASTRRTRLEARQESFGSHIPSREELQKLKAAAEAVRDHEIRSEGTAKPLENERLERLKRYFRHGVPSEAEVLEQIGHWNSLQDGMQKRLHLEEQQEAEKQAMEAAETELKRLEAAADLAVAEKKKAQSQKKLWGILLLAAGIILGLLTAVIPLNSIFWIPSGLLSLVGVLLMLLPVILSGAKEDVPMGETQMIRLRQKEREEKIEGLKQTLRAQDETNRAEEASVRAFLEQREIMYSRADAENLLYEIKNRRAEYQSLLSEEEEAKQKVQRLEEEGAALRRALETSLQEVGLTQTFQPTQHAQILDWIAQTLQNLAAYESEKREDEAAQKALKAFLEEHPGLGSAEVSDLSEESLKEQEEALTARVQELSVKESGIHETISAYGRSLDEAYDELERLREEQERQEALKEERDALAARYQLVEKTDAYLKAAKEGFIARFMQPVKSAFDGYNELVTGRLGSDAEFQIDANMNIYRKEVGEFRDVEAQSEGLGEVIGLCIRMALLDVMYEKEGPLVILDDPFSGMDARHLAGAKRFLEEVAKKYQILYLTCHESRKMK